MENVLRLPPERGVKSKALQLAYREGALLAVEVEQRGGGSARVDYRFPKYERTNSELCHVSAVQIAAAIIEGGVCVLEDALLSNLFPAAAEPEWFYSTLENWLLLRNNTLYRRQLQFGEVAHLDFRILDIGIQRLRRRKLSATFECDGFCSGESVWIIDPPPGMII